MKARYQAWKLGTTGDYGTKHPDTVLIAHGIKPTAQNRKAFIAGEEGSSWSPTRWEPGVRMGLKKSTRKKLKRMRKKSSHRSKR